MMDDSRKSANLLPPGRVQTAVLAGERFLRTHPTTIGLLSVGAFVIITVADIGSQGELPLAVTYAVPLALCTYSVGLVAGLVAAAAVGGVWLIDAIGRGMEQGDAVVIFGARILSSFAIVAVAAVAVLGVVAGGGVTTTPARARERYLEGQRQLAQLRGDLTTAFTHDLRAPLTAIIGYTELLLEGADGPLPEKATATLKRIVENATHLDQLIADMLAAGGGMAGVPLQVTAFEPEALVAALRVEFDGAPRSRDVTLLWQVAPGIPRLRTDRTKLTSVVRNLVGNALKFTRRGTVTVRLDYDAELASHRIEVTDTGPGIAADALPHVFDRFVRIAPSELTPGFGLGLFIVRRFVELLGGSVTVQSEIGSGTRFLIIIPRLPDDAAASPSGSNEKFEQS
jgi:signal transduction histidine kinase